MRLLVIFFSLSFCFQVIDAFPFTGQVISVQGGGTFEVLRNGKPERIRLHGIYCPENGQPFSNDAQQATSDLIFSMDVTIESHGKDKYGRTVAEVQLSDGTNVNHVLVREGWCWWYRKHAPKDLVLEALENEARLARKGLWSDPKPVPPWEWRSVGKQRPSS
ncbi:MAG: thermonuclease family protein [Nitrospira sp.]